VEADKDSWKKWFPHLVKELDSDENRTEIKSVRTDSQTGDIVSSKTSRYYIPDVIDFLRRCETAEQAEEIIAFLEKRGEIKKHYAEVLRKQLNKKGVRSFGNKKDGNYYFKCSEQRV